MVYKKRYQLAKFGTEFVKTVKWLWLSSARNKWSLKYPLPYAAQPPEPIYTLLMSTF